MKFIKEVFNHFFKSNTFQKGAALAYYAVFSLLPMIIILISVFGLLFGKQAVSGEIFQQLKSTLGSDAAMQIQNIIKNHHTTHNSVITTIIGFVTLALSASGMFSQIHNAFNSIWNIKAKPKSSILQYLSKHFFSFVILIVLFFILLISTSVNSFLIHHAQGLSSEYQFAYLYEHIISLIITSMAFAVMFKFLGDVIVHWKVALLGGLITALLFMFGKIAIGMYIGHSHLSSTFGSASVLALLMLWVYYTSQIIFLGASFVEIISNKLGYEILPNNNAVKIKNVELSE
ncbi:YihY/virulence factor BrkB family protein [Flagellimonas myxillae]|uniref:YihY/virulence factor BrkB family protein n=1 Tax=Flagellimonas myxillae TaxID=2942214 RepID=UPI00201EA9E6|nr:YihY/virulence factor BrkB family protein [Muricauda myxillae]MCL6267189.1 YihY/virulence factor BrkB family protein [Muricauda myxillae]